MISEIVAQFLNDMSHSLENMIYLRNCLRSIYNALSEKPSLKYEILIFEVGQLSASKHHERKLGIQSSILNYDNTYLVHPDDELGIRIFNPKSN